MHAKVSSSVAMAKKNILVTMATKKKEKIVTDLFLREYSACHITSILAC